MVQKIVLQFLRPWSIYAAGDTVAFEAARAQALIDSGIAQRCAPPVTAKPAGGSPPKAHAPAARADGSPPADKSRAATSQR